MSVYNALNRLAKWRTLFTGWQLGTRSDSDPEARAVKDHHEVTLLLRAEVSALVTLLVTKKVFTASEWETALTTEAMLLDQDLEKRFPGVESTPHGLVFDLARIKEAGWMQGWKP